MKKLSILTAVFVITLLTVALAPQANARPMGNTIVDIVLADDGEFDVLQHAVVKAGLTEALSTNKQITVFAPTDQAFIDSLGAVDEDHAINIVDSIPNDDLSNILLYHVTNGRRTSESVIDAPRYRMLNGDNLSRTELIDAGISAADISASNGIIHIIDSVLLP